jgi:ring-1,2-phenylacetyl-CoA epoxidase subunit PaaC
MADSAVTARSPGVAVRSLILSLADSKRLLGMRYAEWILGAPELEAGIACASMAQDEWGHARLLYSLLREFDDDLERLEHGRPPEEYASMEVLDDAPADWPGLVVLNAFVDAALTVQLEALRRSAHQPLRQRVEKMLDEERFHGAHGVAWLRRLAGADATRAAAAPAARAAAAAALRWFGPAGGALDELVERGMADAGADELRARYLAQVQPLLERLRLDPGDIAVDFDGFDPGRRRGAGGPDEATLVRVRGDRNRAFLMD